MKMVQNSQEIVSSPACLSSFYLTFASSDTKRLIRVMVGKNNIKYAPVFSEDLLYEN